jgi:mutator protein MutT
MMTGKAAVGILQNGTSTLLIRRMEYPGDPWSGNIAFPGGHIKDGETIEQGLLREINEEVNLNIGEKQIIKPLESVFPNRAPNLKVYPFLIEAHDLSDARPGPEVAEIKIVNLADYTLTKNPQNGFPALEYGGWIVWGLTYRIITSFLGIR